MRNEKKKRIIKIEIEIKIRIIIKNIIIIKKIKKN